MSMYEALRRKLRVVATLFKTEKSLTFCASTEKLESRVFCSIAPLPVVHAPAAVTAIHQTLQHKTAPDISVSRVLDVPDYNWYYGCCPTAIGDVLGYWDQRGYPNVIPGENGNAMTQNVKNAIASPAHIVSGQQDRPGGSHYLGGGTFRDSPAYPRHQSQPDCIADYVKEVDFGTNPYNVHDGLLNYLHSKGEQGWTIARVRYNGTPDIWHDVVKSIQSGMPVVAFVDGNGAGDLSHCVPIIGFDKATHMYAVHNEGDHGANAVKWYHFNYLKPGAAYGIWGVSFIVPPGKTIPGVRLPLHH